MTKDDYIEFCKNLGGAEVDRPFNEDFDSTVARHSDNKKWFALIMEYRGKYVVNLKCEPLEADFLRSVFEGVIPAYHMNKTHWNTVFLESDVPDEEIERMTLVSFALTEKKKRAPKKSAKKSPKNPL
ncbi:MAG: MmcQ/YjbR family DNA-binding protein [Lachnospiraceae bacterium]|nr:MmcQ/YjbR family DNA-binding protein [Lachnospiraceae bacterium]